MARYASEAERYRAHREAFLLALELGCTPKEAERELQRRAARERDAQAERRLAAKMAAPLSGHSCSILRQAQDERLDEATGERWMMRD